MIDDRTVAHVARLSRLELSDEERRQFREQLGHILEHFQTLNALNLDGVPPTAHARATANVLRDDVVRPSLDPAATLANAPAAEDGYFVVPPVILED
ncbi:MAG TPA: Asp-tRNA(Asn)/Glu-tRNA(Gln) amidotransferase subunit GatC [bacterium]|nr:Asp-tRNA(Asn)/Glu-tRNA(Gln) amidotransferase subunit GatC [bacterium]